MATKSESTLNPVNQIPASADKADTASAKPEVKTDTKSEPNSDSKPDPKPKKEIREPVAKMSVATLGAELAKFDESINALVTDSLQQKGPGQPFNAGIVRQIAREEAKKHRMITNRLAALLKRGHPELRPLVEKLLTLEV